MKKTHIHIIGSDEVLSGQYYSTDIMVFINPMSMTLIGYAVTIGNVKNVSNYFKEGLMSGPTRIFHAGMPLLAIF